MITATQMATMTIMPVRVPKNGVFSSVDGSWSMLVCGPMITLGRTAPDDGVSIVAGMLAGSVKEKGQHGAIRRQKSKEKLTALLSQLINSQAVVVTDALDV